MSNKSEGNAFERAFADKLRECRFWVHNLQQNASGQPADIIAVRGGKAYLIDCKVCDTERFTLSRMEDNQIDAMNFWLTCGNTAPYFALRLSDGIYMADYCWLKLISSMGIKSLNGPYIRETCPTLSEWVRDV